MNVPRLVHTVRQLWEAMAALAEERHRFVGGLPEQHPSLPPADCCMHDRRYGPTDLAGVTVSIEAIDSEAFKKALGNSPTRGGIAKALGLPVVESKTLEVPCATYDANGSPVEDLPQRLTRGERVHVVGEHPVPESVLEVWKDEPTAESPAVLDEYVLDPSCVARFPGCRVGGTDPACCRFPKPCSPWVKESLLAKAKDGDG